MPKANACYPFQAKIFDWAVKFSITMTGENRGFVMIFAPDGAVHSVHFGEQEERLPPNTLALKENNASWLIYDPFEGPVYTYIGWQNVQQETMERVIGTSFTNDDFAPHPDLLKYKPDVKPREAFPATSGVMF